MHYQLGDGWDAASGIASAASGAVQSIFNWKTGTEVAKTNENIARIQATTPVPGPGGFQVTTPMIVAAGLAALLIVGVVAWRR